LSRKRSVRNNSCQQHAACLRSRCLSECRSRQPGSAPGPGSGVDRELTVRPGRGVERKSKQRLSHTGLSAGPVGLRNKEQTAPGEALVRFWRTRVRFPPPPRRGVCEPSSRHAAGRPRAARRSRAGRVPPSLAALPHVIVRWRSRRKQSCTTGSSGPPGTARAGSNRSASRCASPSPPCTVTSLIDCTWETGRGAMPRSSRDEGRLWRLTSLALASPLSAGRAAGVRTAPLAWRDAVLPIGNTVCFYGAHGQVMVSLPDDLLADLDRAVRVRRTTRSGLLAEAARRELQRRDPETLHAAFRRMEARAARYGVPTTADVEAERAERDQRDGST